VGDSFLSYIQLQPTMNEKLQAQISQILAQIMVSVGEVKDFSMSQLPDIAQQYLTYGLWSTVFYVAISLVVLIVSAIAWYKIWKYVPHDSEDVLFLMIPSATGILSTAILFNNLHQLILILTAPKVWFLLEIKNIL
jgi:hypothetical protein